jgi:hypothetical protein
VSSIQLREKYIEGEGKWREIKIGREFTSS